MTTRGLPKFFDVLGRRYAIRYSEQAINPNTGELVAGYCQFSTRQIGVSTGQKPDDIWETLIHEFGHAVFHEAGFASTSFSSDLEEIVVEQFAKVFHKNFRFRKGRK